MKHAAKQPVTIKSIAQELGISFSTVSKALNNNPMIKAETRELVQAKAREMGYTPNTLAKGLRGSTTKTIAVIFNDLENPVLTYIFSTISIEMAKHGYTTMIFDSQFSLETERANILTVLSRQPDFIILEPCSTNTENLELLQGFEEKLILQGAEYPGYTCHHVHVDYAHGGYLSANEMIQHHRTDCLVITEPLEFPISAEYIRGIREAYAAYQPELTPERLITTHSSITSGAQAIYEIWDRTAQQFFFPVNGVLTFDDHLAHGVYKALRQLNVRIPEEISIIGFDDNPLSEFSDPPLSTIHLPREKMAESCLSIIRSVLLDGDKNIRSFSLVPNLVSRHSVADMR